MERDDHLSWNMNQYVTKFTLLLEIGSSTKWLIEEGMDTRQSLKEDIHGSYRFEALL